MKRFICLFLVAVTLFSFASCGVKISDSHIPELTLTDRNGEEVKISDFFGKPIVINFWATWCGFCVEEFPAFENAYEKYGDDVAFVMINSGETVEKAEAFIKEKGYSFPIYFDLNGKASINYNVSGFPTTFFVEADGELAYKKVGAITEGELVSRISAICKD